MASEFELIGRYFSPATHQTRLAGGDDAALLEPRPGFALAVSTDMLVEGVHFLPGTDPEALGHKALAVNLSDLAAMGAEPRWVFLALALPEADETWVAAFSRGLLQLARDHGVDLAGGDTTRGPRNLCLTIVGEVPVGRALRRDRARAGHDVWLSGVTGEAAAGLAVAKGALALPPVDAARCLERLHRPQPRVALGRALAGIAAAAIDVSDGLLADAGHIAERSNIAVVIDAVRLPASSVLATLPESARFAATVAGGDDYELCFTAEPAQRDAVQAAAATAGTPVTRIGRCEVGGGVRVLDRSGTERHLQSAGFDHFR